MYDICFIINKMNMDMRLPVFLRSYRADLVLHEEQTHELRQAYKEVLQMDGVAFPDQRVKDVRRLQDAWAAECRGAPILENDGSPVDLRNYNDQETTAILREYRKELTNDERLDSLVDMRLTAKAGSLLVNRLVGYYGEGGHDPAIFRTVMDGYKQWVQIGIAVEEWGESWGDIVARGFEGTPDLLPLTKDAILPTIRFSYSPWVRGLDKDYFPRRQFYRFNTFNYLDNRLGNEDNEGQLATAAAIGTLYRLVPKECDQVLTELRNDGVLSPEIDWQKNIVEATNHAAQMLLND